MAGSAATWLDLIPGAQQGVAYLMGQVAKFQRLPQVVQAIETGAIYAKAKAEERGKLGYATRLALVLQSTASLRDKYVPLSAQLATVIEGVKAAGFGITPVETAAMAVSTAAKIAALFAATDATQNEMLSAARAVLTPEEMGKLQTSSPFSGAAAVGAGAALLVGGTVVALLFFGGRGRGRRRVR